MSIEVTPDIAIKLRIMAESGLFSLKDGNATLNFKNGQLLTIKSELYTYSKDIDLFALQETHVKIVA